MSKRHAKTETPAEEVKQEQISQPADALRFVGGHN